MKHDKLLREITLFCERHGIAESTLGRLAVNDGKFVRRASGGATIGAGMIDRIRRFMQEVNSGQRIVRGRSRRKRSVATREVLLKIRQIETSVRPYRGHEYNDERQKHHLLANTCNEKWVIADRCYAAVSDIRITAPALRIFDGSLGNGIILARLLRALHKQHAQVPFVIVAKERGLDDLRNALGRMADRFLEHPLTVLAVTNMYFDEAAALSARTMQAALSLNWREVALTGGTAFDFQQQISALHPQLADDWRIISSKGGQALYERPNVLVFYRKDYEFLLKELIPKPGSEQREYDFIMASHLYRHTASIDFKIRRVLAPLARRLAPGGRMMVIQSYGEDPAHEVVKRLWKEAAPGFERRQEIVAALRAALGELKRKYTFSGATDKTSLFRFDMHTLPIDPQNEISDSTLLIAWNNLVYVCQIPEREVNAMTARNKNFLAVTLEVIKEYKGLWFINESFIIKRSGG